MTITDSSIQATSQSRIAVGVEYDGANYHGWQIQRRCGDNADSAGTDATSSLKLITLQERLETALSRVAAHSIKVFCAGRTDVGVHACGQVAHFDTSVTRTMRAWMMGCNSYLPADIRILWAEEVPNSFHARFSAIARTYRYIIYNHRIASALWGKRALWFPHRLNTVVMQEAANYLIGEHDFSSFRASSCQSLSTKRCVTNIDICSSSLQPPIMASTLMLAPEIADMAKPAASIITIDITANAFLHHMVRNIVGVLLDVGAGKKPPHWCGELLAARDRKKGSATALPDGLYLMRVDYQSQHHIINAKHEHE